MPLSLGVVASAGGGGVRPLLITADGYSFDGITWVANTRGWSGSQTARAAVWADDLPLWLLIGYDSFVATGLAAISGNGVTGWTFQTEPFSGSVGFAAAWDGSVFVGAVAGTVATSPDGVTWTTRTITNFSNVRGAAYSPSLDLFVIVGSTTSGPSSSMNTSPDGTTWTDRTSSFGVTQINAVTWSPALGLFVAIGNDGKLATSSNGTAWTQRTSSFSADHILGVAWSEDAGKFVAVGGSNKIATSPDGTTWTQRTSAFSSGSIVGVTRSDDVGLFAAVGSGAVQTSPDGVTWTQRSASIGSTFVAAGATGVAA